MTTKEPDNKVPPFEAFLLGQLAGICSDIADTAVKIMQDGFDASPPNSSKTNREYLAHQCGVMITKIAELCKIEIIDHQIITNIVTKHANELNKCQHCKDKGDNHDHKRNGGS